MPGWNADKTAAIVFLPVHFMVVGHDF